jgi:EpsI family protein
MMHWKWSSVDENSGGILSRTSPPSIVARAVFVIVLLVAAAVVERTVSGAEATVTRAPLESLPFVLGEWQGEKAAPLAKDVVALLGADEHIYRTYVRAGIPVGLYAGYYDSQRRGDTIHSPQNCLPGAGWHPVSSGTLQLAGAVHVNQYLIQKGLQQQVVLYWYQGRGRVVANEYANKAFLMWDAARLRRTNGGLVRIITPVTTSTDAAVAQAAGFASALLPKLEGLMP